MSTSRPLFWINAGEYSGEMHGASLLQAMHRLAPQTAEPGAVTGMGGDEMEQAGCDIRIHVKELSVMGVTEVLAKLPAILGLLKRIKQHLTELRPRAVILVDAPSFNFRVAKAAHKLGIPVHYYISPKIWAWNTGRVKFINRYVDRMICILPFEVDFYKRFGVDVTYAGNPLVDRIQDSNAMEIQPEPNRIGILPGSRSREISTLTPILGPTAELIRQRLPQSEFLLIRAPGVEEEYIRSLWPADVPVEILPGENRYALMRSCSALLAASGSVTLESALLQIPTIITYRVSALSGFLMRRAIKVPYVGLPNLILNESVFPEYLQENARPEVMSQEIVEIITKPQRHEEIMNKLQRLKEIMGPPGGPERTARMLLEAAGIRVDA